MSTINVTPVKTRQSEMSSIRNKVSPFSSVIVGKFDMLAQHSHSDMVFALAVNLIRSSERQYASDVACGMIDGFAQIARATVKDGSDKSGQAAVETFIEVVQLVKDPFQQSTIASGTGRLMATLAESDVSKEEAAGILERATVAYGVRIEQGNGNVLKVARFAHDFMPEAAKLICGKAHKLELLELSLNIFMDDTEATPKSQLRRGYATAIS